MRVLLILLLAVPAAAQEEPEEPKKPAIDLDYRVENPLDLLAPQERFDRQWRRIWRNLGTRYHLYPAEQAGNGNGPPRIFGGGWNYSLWRDPVTGWPAF